MFSYIYSSFRFIIYTCRWLVRVPGITSPYRTRSPPVQIPNSSGTRCSSSPTLTFVLMTPSWAEPVLNLGHDCQLMGSHFCSGIMKCLTEGHFHIGWPSNTTNILDFIFTYIHAHTFLYFIDIFIQSILHSVLIWIQIFLLIENTTTINGWWLFQTCALPSVIKTNACSFHRLC